MRVDIEMFDIILKTAKDNDVIRAVYMNGSRANPNVKKDVFQDFDIVYLVTDIAPFLDCKNWICDFGEVAILQEPDSKEFGWGENHDNTKSYTWLILFKDGNRIDLNIMTVETGIRDLLNDSLCAPLLDKDNILADIPPSSDRVYHVKKPTKEEYNGCCNEFWWCLNNVAKGIVREQLSYSQRMYSQTVLSSLDKMLEWYIGTQYNFAVNTGMWGKYFKDYLSSDIYEQYTKVYSDSDFDNFWNSIFCACDLFRLISQEVADKLNFTYNHNDDKEICNYLLKMRELTKRSDNAI